MNTEPNVGQPPTEAIVMSPRRRLTTRSDVSNTSFHKRFKDARSVAISILQETDWPRRSRTAAQELLQTIEHSPNVKNLYEDNSIEPEDLREAVGQFTRVLEEVGTKLEHVKLKYGIRKRGVRERIKYFLTMLRGGRCTQMLQIYKDDVSKASTSVNVDQGVTASGVTASGVAARAQQTLPAVDDNAPVAPTPEIHDAAETPAEHLASSQGSAAAVVPQLPQGQPSDSSNKPEKNAGRRKALDVAGKIFSAVEMASGLLPAFGQYIGAGAKVGLTCVEMVQVMYDNDDAAEELTSRTTELSELLKPFEQRSFEPEKEKAIGLVRNLQWQLQLVRSEIEKLRSESKFIQFVSSGDRADKLKEWEQRIRTTMDDMQLVINLKTADHVIDIYLSTVRKEREELLDRLGDGKYGARNDAIENVVCLPGTRVVILERISNWANGSTASGRVMWLHGMAGRGKSAIASTIAYEWQKREATSCALFHFRRGQRELGKHLVCALARQLVGHGSMEVREAIRESVRENRDIATMRLEDQFRILIVNSLQKIQSGAPQILFVVDGLDECEDSDYAVRFVKAIKFHSSSLPPNVKFLVTSRPEDPLARALQQPDWLIEDLEMAVNKTEDVVLFFEDAFSKIREDHGLKDDWASPNAIATLANLSQALFQWARTAIAYINAGWPPRRLHELLQPDSNWSGLDELYHQIISQAYTQAETNQSRGKLFIDVLGLLVVTPYPISLEIIAYFCAEHETCIGMTEQEDVINLLRQDILTNLTSIISIPASTADPLQFMHTSIRDLLTDIKRCGNRPYYIDLSNHHHEIGGQCIKLMQRDLKRNICNLSDLSKPNSDAEIQSLVYDFVSWGLLYCCHAWSIHLIAGSASCLLDTATDDFLEQNLKPFSEQKLLCWLEVMSLTAATGEAIVASKQVLEWLKVGENDPLLVMQCKWLTSENSRQVAMLIHPYMNFGMMPIGSYLHF